MEAPRWLAVVGVVLKSDSLFVAVAAVAEQMASRTDFDSGSAVGGVCHD